MKAGEVLPFSESMNAVGRPVTYYPNIAKALSDTKAAIFVSNFIYWDGKQASKQGWIFKTQEEIYQETGLTRYEQETARKRLKSLEILLEKKQGTPPKLYYLFDWGKLDKVMQSFFNGDIEKPKKVFKSILYEMKEIFDLKYVERSNGIEFEWGGEAGKHWRGLKSIQLKINNRLISKKTLSNPEVQDYVPSNEEIIDSWQKFIDIIPEFHLNRNLTPERISNNWNEILNDMANASRDKKKAAAPTGSTAKDYV